MDFEWEDLVTAVAPKIATVIGGPVAGLATKALSEAVFGDDKHSEKEIMEAIHGASPELLAKIKKADQDFELRLKEVGIRLEDIAARDRNSARDMQKSLKSWIVPSLASMTVMGFFLVVYFVLMGEVSIDSTLAGFVLGQVSAKAEQVYNFYFGSSAGSKEKTKEMTNAFKKGAA